MKLQFYIKQINKIKIIKLKNNYKYNKISNNEIMKRRGLFWLKVLETSSPQSVGPVTIGLRVTH